MAFGAVGVRINGGSGLKELLSRIKGPEDVRRLGLDELERLAQEMREEIIETVSVNGGHLAPNLGVVELTIALHRIFESPIDQIVWDTGHQCYPHKLLTGRAAQFRTLRRAGGLSGFCKRRESPHDTWEAGHAGTAISAALGLAMARDRLGRSHHVVAVVGDGALTAGMSFEALNHAGNAGTRLVVVLNDNSMSISPNVGAFASYLTRLRAGPSYHRLKEDLTRFLERIPRLGPAMSRTAERLKDSIKHFLLPGMLFEDLGFTYLGPVDGHNLPALLDVLGNARRLGGPVLVHVVTQKGRGYRPAEARPDLFHGVGAFDRASGQPLDPPVIPSHTSVFGRALVRLAEDHTDICAITAAMPEGTGLTEFAARFPDRCFDVGIAEQHAVTFAGGLASAGLRPVVAIYSTFLQRAYDQIVHDVCLQNLPVLFAIDRAGLVGADGETHQGAFDIAYLRHVPNLTLAVPKDENELQHLLATGLLHPGPFALRYPRGSGIGVALDASFKALPVGRAELIRKGRHVAILALGPLVYAALEAARRLSASGVEAAVVNARFVKPLDEELIVGLARECGAVVTVEEHVRSGGFGSAVLELLAAHGLSGVRATVLGLPDLFVEHGDRQAQLSCWGLDASGIAAAAMAVATVTQRDPVRRRAVARRAAKG